METMEKDEVVVRRFLLDRIGVWGNARQRFDEGELEGLYRSFGENGEPMHFPVGYVSGELDAYGFDVEIFVGERRLRAMEWGRDHLGGPNSMLVRVVAKPSERVFRMMNLVENAQRVDLLPSEAGMWMRDMLAMVDEDSERALWTRASLAEEMGKPVSYVAHRLLALEAPERVRAALDAGAVAPEVAAMIGALPAGIREQAAEVLCFGLSGAMSVDDARRYAAEHFRRDLRRADFDREDGELLPSVGACTGCEWYGRNRKDVPGRSGEHACLDPDCFGRKQRAAAERERARLADEGCEDVVVVLPPERGARLFEEFSGRLDPTCGFVDLDAKPDHFFLEEGSRNSAAMPKWRAALGDDCPMVHVVWDGEDRKHELVECGPALASALKGRYGSLFREEAARKLLSKEESVGIQSRKAAVDREGRAVCLEGADVFRLALQNGEGCSAAALREVVLLAADQGLKPDDFVFLCEMLDPDLPRGEMTGRGFEGLVSDCEMDGDGLLALLVVVLQVRMLRYRGFDSWCEADSPMGRLCGLAEFDAKGWRTRWKRRRAAAERAAGGEE